MPREWLRFGLVTVLLTVLLAGVYIAPSFGHFWHGRYLEFGDLANNALRIDDARRLREIYGNFSRFHFYHPGPAFWYLYALGEAVLHDWSGLVSSAPYAHILTGTLFQTLCVVGAIMYLGRRLGGVIVVPAVVLLMVHWHWMTGAPTSIWPPHVLFGPFVLFVVAAAAVAAGETRVLPVMIVAGSFLVHGHVGQPLQVIPLAAFALVSWYRSSRNEGVDRERVPVLLSIALLAIFLLPIGIDAAKGAGSNAARIVAHLKETGEHHSFTQSIGYSVSYFRYEASQVLLPSPVDLPLRAYKGTTVADWRLADFAGLLPFLVTAPYLVVGRHATRLTRMLVSMEVATFVLCLVWGMLADGPMYDFNGNYFYAVTYLMNLTPIVAIAIALRSASRGSRRIVALASVVVAVAVVPFAKKPIFTVIEPAEELQRNLVRAMGDERQVVVELDPKVWVTGFGVILALERLGIAFSCPIDYPFLCGERIPVRIRADGARLSISATPCDGFVLADFGFGTTYVCRRDRVDRVD